MTAAKEGSESLVGAVLDGRYRIESLLGEGGMGSVYAATDLRLEKRVAIKVMARELATNADALARFHREARVTSGLGHPHIVQVFDFSTTPTGEPFLVMEFLEGEDLDRRLRRAGPLRPSGAAHIVKQVASALAATHAKDIVHRDLKPGNIYLLKVAGEMDFVKVLDFGISKVRTASTKLTRTASIVGTPNYMSPEQAKGRIEDIDDRTDQWALACIVWECLSGQAPFVGENVPSILFQIVHESPHPLPKQVTAPCPKVEEVLLRALAKDKKDRFPRVSDFAIALAVASATAAEDPPSTARTAVLSTTAIDFESQTASSTTFTQTAGEVASGRGIPIRTSKRWLWPAAAGAGVTLFLLILLWLRPAPATRPMQASPPPAPSLPAQLPLGQGLAPQPDAKIEEDEHRPAAVPAESTPQPQAAKPEPDSPHRQTKKRPANKKPEEEDQQLWH